MIINTVYTNSLALAILFLGIALVEVSTPSLSKALLPPGVSSLEASRGESGPPGFVPGDCATSTGPLHGTGPWVPCSLGVPLVVGGRVSSCFQKAPTRSCNFGGCD